MEKNSRRLYCSFSQRKYTGISREQIIKNKTAFMPHYESSPPPVAGTQLLKFRRVWWKIVFRGEYTVCHPL